MLECQQGATKAMRAFSFYDSQSCQHLLLPTFRYSEWQP